jgi:peroxiredoxin
MNKFFILSFSLLFSACANSQTDVKTTQNQPAPTTPAQPTFHPNYVESTSRNPDQIKKEFPYDIDLKAADGTVINSSKVFKKNGKPTVLMFWLTTCTPCRYELEAISEKYDFWQGDTEFNFYAISTDFPKNYEKFVQRVNEHKWPWQAYNDVNREFMFAMPGQLNGLPQVFVLDKKGNIVYHTRKYSPGDEDILFSKIKETAGKG